MVLRIGDVVKIQCRSSKYDGIVGEIFEIEESSRYATIDLPKGTEFRIEGIRPNVIIERMMQSERTRKTPIKRWPKGDPQWFPMEWLVVVRAQQPGSPEAAEISA